MQYIENLIGIRILQFIVYSKLLSDPHDPCLPQEAVETIVARFFDLTPKALLVS